MPLLEVKDLSVKYGRQEALRNVSLEVKEGEIVTVLGANGAGKSTLLKSLLGVEKPHQGSIRLHNNEVTSQPAHKRLKDGLVLVPEGRRILISQTIEENLLLGAYTRQDEFDMKSELAEIYQRFPNLAERRKSVASCLSGGEQQMLAVGRALLAKPKLLMLDEPSLGLSPLFVQKLFGLMRELNKEGISILLVEQNTEQALKLAHRAYVLDQGEVSLSGSAKDIAQNSKLAEVYLGV